MVEGYHIYTLKVNTYNIKGGTALEIFYIVYIIYSSYYSSYYIILYIYNDIQINLNNIYYIKYFQGGSPLDVISVHF